MKREERRELELRALDELRLAKGASEPERTVHINLAANFIRALLRAKR